MKGVVFTEFLEMVEDKFSIEIADTIIDEAELSNDGAYTSVGTYDAGELVKLVVNLSRHTDIAIPDLLRVYGEHLFNRFYEMHPKFFENMSGTFEFLPMVDQYIHVEVKKLYPDAELPEFIVERKDDNVLVMRYRSARAFGDFAEGLIRGCISHFGEDIEISREELAETPGGDCRFTLDKKAAA